jgi:hypothetical protein
MASFVDIKRFSYAPKDVALGGHDGNSGCCWGCSPSLSYPLIIHQADFLRKMKDRGLDRCFPGAERDRYHPQGGGLETIGLKPPEGRESMR